LLHLACHEKRAGARVRERRNVRAKRSTTDSRDAPPARPSTIWNRPSELQRREAILKRTQEKARAEREAREGIAPLGPGLLQSRLIEQFHEQRHARHRCKLPQLTRRLPALCPCRLGLGRIVPMPPRSLASPFQAIDGSRSGAEPAMHAATPIRHRGLTTRATIATTSTAPRRSVRGVKPFADHRRMGFIAHFRVTPLILRGLPPVG
jgi:hypothetical protein